MKEVLKAVLKADDHDVQSPKNEDRGLLNTGVQNFVL